jgi:hypothetical protein
MRLALVLTLDEERENNEKQRRGEGKCKQGKAEVRRLGLMNTRAAVQVHHDASLATTDLLVR